MDLPDELTAALDRESTRFKSGELAAVSEKISAQYRTGTAALAMEADRVAYAVTRMPATYAAARAVLNEVQSRVVEPIRGVLDLGAGTGAATWAALDVFPGIERVTAVENNRGLIDLARKLAGTKTVQWQATDLRGASEFEPHDLVACSYALGELERNDARATVDAAWRATRVALAIIEPGTPAGFAVIRAARDQLIACGASVVAPCPHDAACPMAGADWCHFAQRLNRTSLHRRLKGGSLGYEDEKYSYIAVARFPAPRVEARVIRHPLQRPGFVQLELCTADGLRRRVVTRREKEAYRAARHTRWGGAGPA